jgi:hypothetical protein
MFMINQNVCWRMNIAIWTKWLYLAENQTVFVGRKCFDMVVCRPTNRQDIEDLRNLYVSTQTANKFRCMSYFIEYTEGPKISREIIPIEEL